MDLHESGIPGDDWNGGVGGERGPAGPPARIEPKAQKPWYVAHLEKQRKKKG